MKIGFSIQNIEIVSLEKHSASKKFKKNGRKKLFTIKDFRSVIHLLIVAKKSYPEKETVYIYKCQRIHIYEYQKI